MATVENKPVTLRVDHVAKIFKVSNSEASRWHPIIKDACDAKDINTVLRLAGFLAQIGIESGNLKYVEENLNYSSSGLLSTFPKYFDSSTASAYARQPQKIASRVYGNRMGNGPETTTEGWQYRGRGLIQITGKQNYIQCNRAGVPCISNPDYLKTDKGAVESAVWFWNSRGCNSLADRNMIDLISKRVNGGANHINERRALYEWAIKVLLDLPETANVEIQPSRTDDKEQEPTPNAKHGSFSEPSSQAAPQYPYNQVYESRSGHLIEIDDTPDHERLHWYHRVGTYMEMFPDGKFVTKAVGDRYDFTNGDAYVSSDGDYTAKVSGQYYLKVLSEMVISSSGSITIESSGNVQINAPTVSASTMFQVPLIEAQMFRMTSGEGGFGELADLKARDSAHADLADDISSESAGGQALSGIQNSMSFGSGGAPTFTKPVSMSQPTKMPVYSTGQLPTPSDYPDSIAIFNNGTTKAIVFSDGTAWKKTDGTTVT